MRVQDIVEWLKSQVSEQAQLRLDSRQVESGDVFFACPGIAGDGRNFIDNAVAAGAAAVVMQAPAPEAAAKKQGKVPVLVVEDLLPLLGEIADAWYGQPSRKLSVVAITGTNGKTSSVQWLA